MLSKILAYLALQRANSSNSLLLQQLLAGAGTVIFLSLIAAFLASILIAGTVCLCFNLLVTYGLSQQAAMVTLGIIMLIFMIILIGLTLYYVQKLRMVTSRILTVESPLASRATHMAQAFFDGFKRRKIV